MRNEEFGTTLKRSPRIRVGRGRIAIAIGIAIAIDGWRSNSAFDSDTDSDCDSDCEIGHEDEYPARLYDVPGLLR